MPTPGDKAKYRRLRAKGASHAEAVAMSATTTDPDFGGGGGTAAQTLAARVKRTTDWSVPTTATVYVPWEVASYDTGGFFNLAAPTRLTVPEAGLYLVGFYLRYAVHATGRRQGLVLVNGTTNHSPDVRAAMTEGGVTTGVGTSVLISLAAGDYVELGAYQNSGVALNLEAFIQEMGCMMFIAKQS